MHLRSQRVNVQCLICKHAYATWWELSNFWCILDFTYLCLFTLALFLCLFGLKTEWWVKPGNKATANDIHDGCRVKWALHRAQYSSFPHTSIATQNDRPQVKL